MFHSLQHIIRAACSGYAEAILRRYAPLNQLVTSIKMNNLLQIITQYKADTERYRAAHPELVEELAATLIAELPPLEFYLKHVQARQEFDVLACLEGLNVPALIIVGAEETILEGTLPHLEAARRIHAIVPASRLYEVPAATHGYFWQEPATVNRVIEDFLLNPPA